MSGVRGSDDYVDMCVDVRYLFGQRLRQISVW
jgi:hypothetical protein